MSGNGFSWRTEKRFKEARLRAASAADTVRIVGKH